MLAKEAVETALNAELDEHLGMWLSENEGAKCADGVTKSGGGGVKDILIACVDGLKGFPNAINTAFPNTQILLYIVLLNEICTVERLQGSRCGSKGHLLIENRR